MFSRNGIAPGIYRADANRHAARRPGLQVRRRNADLPAAAGVNRGDVLHIVDGDNNLRARGQMVLEPVTLRSCCCSMALITSSPEMVFTRRPGSSALILISRSPVPVLPCPLVTDAVKVKSPSPNA